MVLTKNAELGLERKDFTFELKDVQPNGTFTGYAACFNNVDSDNDKILPGAFTDSLAASGPGCPILWQHDQKQPIGVNQKASQDEKGLAVEGQLVLDVRQASEGYALLKAKAIKGLSIGYRVLDYSYEGGVRLLKKLQLMEYSLVTFPANQLAAVESVKSAVPGSISFQSLPMASASQGWDYGAARGRILKWAGGPDVTDWAKVRKCFVWFDDEHPENFSGYRMPIADIVNGQPIAVPKAVKAAADALIKREGLNMPEEAVEASKAHLEMYFKKLGEESPFEVEDKGVSKTKKVDGVDLPASSFAYVGDPDKTDTWKLPIDFPGDDEKSKSHIRNALARFSQTEGIPESERAAVLAKIHAAAKKHGIDKGKSLDPAGLNPTATGEPGEGENPVSDFNATLAHRQALEAHNKSLDQIVGAHREAMRAVYKHPTMDADAKKAAVTKNFEQYTKAMTDWHCKNIELGKKDDPGDYNMPYGSMSGSGPDETKGGRTISRATGMKIKAAHQMIEDAKSLLDSGSTMLKEMGASVEANEDFGGVPGGPSGTGTEPVEVPGTGKGEDFKDIFKKALDNKAA